MLFAVLLSFFTCIFGAFLSTLYGVVLYRSIRLARTRYDREVDVRALQRAQTLTTIVTGICGGLTAVVLVLFLTCLTLAGLQ